MGFVAKIARRVRAYRAVRSAHAASQARLNAGPMRHLLIICYGNIYRSAILAEYLRPKLMGVAEVRSGGFHPKEGRPSPPRHVELGARLGVPLAEHRSRLTRPEDLDWADTIVLMDRHNWDALQGAGGDVRKYVWIGTLTPGPVEIDDPYAVGDAQAEQLVRRLLSCGERLSEAVRRSVG